MKKRKLKPIVFVILAAVIVIFAAVGASRYFKKPGEVVTDETTTNSEGGSGETNPAGNTSADGKDINVIQNNGNIEIVIPDDMESDGF